MPILQSSLTTFPLQLSLLKHSNTGNREREREREKKKIIVKAKSIVIYGFVSFFLFFFIYLPHCAVSLVIVMHLEDTHATASIGQSWQGGKTDYNFHSVPVPLCLCVCVCVYCWSPGADFGAATTSAKPELSEQFRSCLCHPHN